MGPPDSAPRRRAPSRRRGELTLPRSLSSPRLRLDGIIATPTPRSPPPRPPWSGGPTASSWSSRDGPCRDRTCDLGIKSTRAESRPVSARLAIHAWRRLFRRSAELAVSTRLGGLVTTLLPPGTDEFPSRCMPTTSGRRLGELIEGGPARAAPSWVRASGSDRPAHASGGPTAGGHHRTSRCGTRRADPRRVTVRPAHLAGPGRPDGALIDAFAYAG